MLSEKRIEKRKQKLKLAMHNQAKTRRLFKTRRLPRYLTKVFLEISSTFVYFRI